MKIWMKLGICAWLVLAAAAMAADMEKTAMNYWPSWRGPLATGEAPQARPPVRWVHQSS